VHVDLSQLETLLSIAGEMLLAASVTGEDPARHGNRAAGVAPQGAYPAAGDDAWVVVSVTSDDGWARLAGLLGLGDRAALDLTGRTAAHDELDAAIATWTAGRPAIEVAAELQGVGVPAFPVMTNGMLVEDPHMGQRGFIVSWDQTDVGPIEFPGFPIHFSSLPVRLTGCPGLGEDNEAVLGERLGLTPAEVAALLAEGVLGDRPPR
jgi:crotonobetainyl-CoA:carnitine CoA-transferase CaiB-like acyl-CoA transferase